VLGALTRSIWPYKALLWLALQCARTRRGFMFQTSLPLADNTESPQAW
jgi:hypothetical protein